jgi:uncharacterized membrane protein
MGDRLLRVGAALLPLAVIRLSFEQHMELRWMTFDDRLPGESKVRLMARAALVVFFVIAGTLHFLRPCFYLQIVPPYLPWPLTLVYLSGAFEILGGCAVLPASTRRWAGIGLIALLLAVFPANIHMALHPEPVGGWDVPLGLLWLRLPMQGVLIAWAWWATSGPAAPKQPGC